MSSSPSSHGTRITRSTFNSRVTLYEPVLTPTKPTTSTSTPTSTRSNSKRSTRSSPMKNEDLSEEEEAEAEAEDRSAKQKSKKVKKEPSPRKSKAFVVKLDKAHPEPKRWREAYEIIREQRKRIIAPVDTMGCEQGGRERDTAPPTEKDNRLSILVSLMLSSQTKDPVTHQAVKNLREQLPGGLTLQALLDSTPEQIDNAICKVGFHNIKTGNLKKLAIRLRDLHEGDIPSDLTELLAINGVGPKMAILYLQAIGINAGIGVDVHVHRISNRLGWHKPATTMPEQTRLNLESWLPKEEHPKINLMLVGFGQEICKPVGPRCDLCDVAKVPRLCPSKRTVILPSPRKGVKKDEEHEFEEPELPELEVEVETEQKVEVKVENGVVVETVGTKREVVEAVPKLEPESPEKGALIW